MGLFGFRVFRFMNFKLHSDIIKFQGRYCSGLVIQDLLAPIIVLVLDINRVIGSKKLICT